MFTLRIHNNDISCGLDMEAKQNQELLSQVQKGEECYQDNLGWLDVDRWANEAAVSRLEMLAEQIRAKADVFVLIGVGGSNNAARSVAEALKTTDTPEIIYAGNTLSSNAIERMMKQLEGKSVVINCIAKNFETLEPGLAFRLLRQYLYKRYGESARERIIATGTTGCSLQQLCIEHGYTFLEFPPDIGGRYSAMTNVGLLPMAVAGIDIRSLIMGGKDMQDQLLAQDFRVNMAYRYACMRNLCYQAGYRIELLSCFEPDLQYFFKWWIQLFAESEGKDNKGIFPAAGQFSEELHSLGQFIQEGSSILFETFLDIADQKSSVIIEPDLVEDHFDYLNGSDFQSMNRAAYTATVKAHSVRVPCMELQIGAVDAYHFGQLFYFFQFAAYLSCKLMKVNPFDQPGVESYKAHMFRALNRSGNP